MIAGPAGAGLAPGPGTAAADAPIDLTTCDREPIHVIGHVQPHGALLVLAGAELRVRHASTSAAALLGVDPDAVLDAPLAALVGDEQAARVAAAVEAGAGRSATPVRVEATVHGAARRFGGALHPVRGGVALELEPAPARESMGVDAFATLVRTTVARVEGAATLADAARVVAEEVRALTGYDRVWIYRFHEDWHGEVIAESRAASVRDSWLGLHYPASDIPVPARALFLRQPLRLIADVAYVPSPIVPPEDAVTGEPLDLGDCVLRGVSPVHLQYLRNMGVRASMSISLVRHGGLWGLISCHHYDEPRAPGRDVRAACELLAQAFSLRLTAAEAVASRERALRVQALRARLAERVADADDPLAELARAEPDALLAIVDAEGAVVVTRGEATVVGRTPPASALPPLLDWLRALGQEVASTDALPAAYPAAEAYADVATGVLAVALGEDDWLLWFRPERRQTIAWGGDPRKPAELRDADTPGAAPRLTPRGSFERWEEEVRGRSAPWGRLELDVAAALRAMLVETLLRRAARVEALNRELTRSNDELDAFAFVAAHDLKEPLRGIRNYAEMLREDHGEALGADAARLETIARLATRLDTMIASLFDFSRVGRLELALDDVPLGEVIDDALERLAVAPGRDRVAVRVPRPLPAVRADRERVTEVFFNLLSNALKYSDKPDAWVEVSYALPGEPGADGSDGPVFRVRDNGIGIEPRHHDAVWRLYKRLHPRDAYGGGTGAGLTIVRRIVERHGGRVWLESTPGEGTTVSFTLGGRTAAHGAGR